VIGKPEFLIDTNANADDRTYEIDSYAFDHEDRSIHKINFSFVRRGQLGNLNVGHRFVGQGSAADPAGAQHMHGALSDDAPSW